MALHHLVSSLSGIALLIFSSLAFGGNKYWKGTIAKNVDGDTVWFAPSGKSTGPTWRSFAKETGKTLKIRMIGIDTPETHLPTTGHGIVGQGEFGDNAAEKLADIAPVGTKVVLEDQGQDRYGRTLGRVFLNGKDINLRMVETGWAAPYIICSGSSCDEEFFEREKVEEYVSACEAAERAGKGIFDKKNPLKEMPFEFRLRMQKRQPDKYVGDYYTGELFDPADYKKVPVCHRVFFLTIKDAERAGFSR